MKQISENAAKMPNPENLKGHEFQKGKSGNPKGKPKGTLSAKTVIKKWLEAKEDFTNPITGEKETLTQYDIIAISQLKKARHGDTRAFEAILDRVEGKPKQEIDVNQDIVWHEEKTYVKKDTK